MNSSTYRGRIEKCATMMKAELIDAAPGEANYGCCLTKEGQQWPCRRVSELSFGKRGIL